MKLLMENWRGYIKETEEAAIYGDLYLFEGDDVSKTSFYDAISTLSESDEDVTKFLENWERSVDYMFENLQEQTGSSVIDDAVLKASTQAYLTIQRFKDKAIGPVINVMKKLKTFEKENPKTAKAIKFTIAGLAAAVAVYGIHKALQSGTGIEGVEELSQTLSTVEPDVAQDVAQVAQDLSPETVQQVVADQEQTLSQVTDALAQSGDQGLEQVSQAAESTDFTQTFGEMMADLEDIRMIEKEEAYDSSEWSDQYKQWVEDNPERYERLKNQIKHEAEQRAKFAHEFADTEKSGVIDWAEWNNTASGAGNEIPQEVYDEYGPLGQKLLDAAEAAVDNEALMDAEEALENARQDWAQYKQFAEFFEGGGSLNDIGMSKKEFTQWANRSVDPSRRLDIDFSIPSIDTSEAQGYIPPNYMKWLRKAMRASLRR